MGQTATDSLQLLGIGGDVLYQEIEELIECRIMIIAFGGTHQHYLTTIADDVLNLVTLAQFNCIAIDGALVSSLFVLENTCNNY